MRIERKIGASVAIMGSLLLAVSAAAPALARSGPSAELSRAVGLRIATANSTSTTFGGWTFGPKGATSVTSEFKIPTLKCTSTLSGFAPLATMITGTSSAQKFNAAGVLLACQNGAPAAEVLAVINDSAKPNTDQVAGGDLMKATVTTSSTKTTATVSDLTKGHTFTLTNSAKEGAALEELIMDDSLSSTSTGKKLPVVNFGKLSLTNGAVSGKAIGTVTPKTAVNMVNTKKVVEVLVGPITGTKKNTFLTTWKHS